MTTLWILLLLAVWPLKSSPPKCGVKSECALIHTAVTYVTVDTRVPIKEVWFRGKRIPSALMKCEPKITEKDYWTTRVLIEKADERPETIQLVYR